jgi:uncharacterized protein (TIGR03435 family)
VLFSLLVLASSGVCLPVAIAQAGSAPGISLQRWSYDAVSVKPNNSGTDGLLTMMRGDVYSGKNMRIINLASQAYGVKQDLISGLPAWADTAHYDVEAKMTPEDAEAFNTLSREEKIAVSKALLLGILEERFHLKAHVETRQLPVYDLVIAKGGLKIKARAEGDTAWRVVKGPDGEALPRFREGLVNEQAIATSSFVGQLTNLMHRMVIDKTGLTGRFDILMFFAPPDRNTPSGASDGTPSNDAPSIFVAMEEQLGLKLQPDKGPVDTLVIDHVELPTDN